MSIIVWMGSNFPDPFFFLCDGFENIILQAMIYFPNFDSYYCHFSADGMMFGGLSPCSLCSGFLRYSGGMYRCTGYISEWSKCSYSTCEPKRAEGKWKIPKETDNQYLKKVCKKKIVIEQVGYCDLFLYIVYSGSNLKKGRNQLGYCLRHHQGLLLKVKFLQASTNHQTVKLWLI